MAEMRATAQAADAILALINTRPQTPTRDEIAAIINKATSAALPPLTAEHIAYRKLQAEIKRHCDEEMEGSHEEIEASEAVLSDLMDEEMAMERAIWAKPADTLADVLLRGEIALNNENGIME
jgi:hypothetical protein